MAAAKTSNATRSWPSDADYREAIAIARRVLRDVDTAATVVTDLAQSWDGRAPFAAYVAKFARKRANDGLRASARAATYERSAATERHTLGDGGADTTDGDSSTPPVEKPRRKSAPSQLDLMAQVTRFIEAEAAYVASVMFNHGKVDDDGTPTGAGTVADWLELAVGELRGRLPALRLRPPDDTFRAKIVAFVERTKKKQSSSGWIEHLSSPPNPMGAGRPRRPRVGVPSVTMIDAGQVVTPASLAWSNAREDAAKRIVRHALALCGLPKVLANRLTAAERVAEQHFIERVVRKHQGPGRGRRKKRI